MVFFLDFTGRFHREGNQKKSITQGTILLTPSKMFMFQPCKPPERSFPSFLLVHLLNSDSSFLCVSSFCTNFGCLCMHTCACVYTCMCACRMSSSKLSQAEPLSLCLLAESPLHQGTLQNGGFPILQYVFIEICFIFNLLI